MGKLMIGGRHVGSTDGGPDMRWPACYRSGSDRRRLGCDGSTNRLGRDAERSVVGKVVEYLKDKLTPDQLAAVGMLLNGEDADVATRPDTLAGDMKTGLASQDAYRFQRQPQRQMSAEAEEDYRWRFPHSDRLK